MRRSVGRRSPSLLPAPCFPSAAAARRSSDPTPPLPASSHSARSTELTPWSKSKALGIVPPHSSSFTEAAPLPVSKTFLLPAVSAGWLAGLLLACFWQGAEQLQAEQQQQDSAGP